MKFVKIDNAYVNVQHIVDVRKEVSRCNGVKLINTVVTVVGGDRYYFEGTIEECMTAIYGADDSYSKGYEDGMREKENEMQEDLDRGE